MTTQNEEKHLIKHALIVGGLTLVLTFVLCYLIYFFLNKTEMTLAEIPGDMFPGVVITGTICALLQISGVKKKVQAGKIKSIDLSRQAAYALVPQNLIGFLIWTGIINFLLWDCGSVGLLYTFCPNVIMPRFVYIAFKSFVTGLGAGFANFHANVFYAGIYK